MKIRNNLKTVPKLERILFFTTLLLIPTQLGKHFWPDFSFIYSLRIDYFAPTVYFWDLLVILLLITWFFRKPKINQKSLTVLLFFLLTQLASLFSLNNIGPALVRFEQLSITGFFGLYIASNIFKDYKELLRKSLSLALLFEGFLAIGQFFTNQSLGFWLLGERAFKLSVTDIAKFNWFGQIFLRPYGTFSHPNVLAAFMVILLPVLIFLNKSKKRYETVITVVSVFLTFSRAATIILLLELLYILRKRIKIIILLFFIFSPLVIIRFNSVVNFDNLSIIRRTQLNELSWAFFKNSPILGIGLNNFINFTSADLLAGPNRFLQPVHNIFFLTLAETGIFGFSGLVILFLYPVFKLWRFRVNALSMILFFCWLVIFFLGMFDHYFLTLPQGQRLLFFIWGLSLSYNQKYD